MKGGEIIKGKVVVLEYNRNECGEIVYTHYLEVHPDRIEERQLNCHNSRDLGLGICNCNFHPIWIDRTYLLEELQDKKLQEIRKKLMDLILEIS